MDKPDTPAELKARALRYIARREHSRAESAESLEGVLRELESKKQLSNERFAEARAHWMERKYGTARIRQDLRRKGVADEIIEGIPPGDELARAKEILRRKYHQPATTREERARRARFLQSRGFSYDTIRRAISGVDVE